MSMLLLIDGYNLLFASDVFASAAGPPTLQRTRDALLHFLADSLDQKYSGRTIVVFDATQAPPGLPRETSFAGLRVLFSRSGQEADDLLEELIKAETAPRELVVVSSDHRIQRAARQRGAKYVDSDQWLRTLHTRPTASASSAPQDDPVNSSAELQKWLTEFSDVDSRKLAPGESPLPPPSTQPPPAPTKKPRKKLADPPLKDERQSFGNPFPPGYGEDVLDED